MDHIVAIVDGGAKRDPTNLQSLCPAHHKVKTAEERKVREERRAGGFAPPFNAREDRRGKPESQRVQSSGRSA